MAKALIFLTALALLVATYILDSRITPIFGAALLLGALIYGWLRNRSDKDASYRIAERATREQREHGTR